VREVLDYTEITRVRTEFIQRGKRDEQFIIILDIDKVFPDEELSVVQGADGEAVGA
jgi:purine-binding chemotaxis protein CheW